MTQMVSSVFTLSMIFRNVNAHFAWFSLTEVKPSSLFSPAEQTNLGSIGLLCNKLTLQDETLSCVYNHWYRLAR